MRAIPPQHLHVARLSALRVIGILAWAVLLVRLFHIQATRAGYLRQAEQQHKCRIALPAERGRILDRNDQSLAVNLASRSFAADPSFLPNPEVAAARVAAILPESKGVLRSRLKGNSSFVWLARHADEHTARSIASLGLPGVFELKETQRCYPLGHCLGQLLGYTNIDNKGIEGIEFGMNASLEGEPGFMISERDATGTLRPELHSVRLPPHDGQDILLTIDATYQMIAEEELEATVLRFNALGATAILMDPNTAQILAMAQYPFSDPNRPNDCPPHYRKNHAITNVYEPGSTFKIVTASAATERRLVAPEDSIFCENGSILIAGRPLHDAHKFGWLSFKQVISHSSNIGTIKVAQTLGTANLYRYVRDFGFGTKTGVDLPGEVDGLVHHPAQWSKRSLATVAIGQEISVTPLQLANAYCAIANGGRLMRPYAIRRVVDSRGQTLQESKPLCIRRVVSDSTARIVTDMLVAAVQEGTGVKARIEGLRIAGKTGTAQKPRLDGPGYAPGQFVASFVGFLPAEDPKLLCLVVVDVPKGLYWGSEAAAPTFKRIVSRILALDSSPIRRDSPPSLARNDASGPQQVVVPDLRGCLVFDAKRLLAAYRLTPTTRGDGRHVAGQSIAPGRRVEHGTQVMLTTQDDKQPTTGPPRPVPDVRGLSLRTAVAALAASGLDVRIKGTRTVTGQFPVNGTSVSAGALCVLEGDHQDPWGVLPVRLSALE